MLQYMIGNVVSFQIWWNLYKVLDLFFTIVTESLKKENGIEIRVNEGRDSVKGQFLAICEEMQHDSLHWQLHDHTEKLGD